MNRLLIVAILLISTSQLYSQGAQQNVAKLKDVRRNPPRLNRAFTLTT